MPAANTDLLKKYLSLFSTTLSTGIGTGTSDTITPASVASLPTDTAITLTFDRVDSSGVATPTKMERIKGVISGGNLVSYVRGVDGTTEQAHSAGAVIEMVWNADDWNNMVTWGLVSHNQAGYLSGSAVVASNIAASAITAGTLAASSVMVGNLSASITATASDVASATNNTLVVTPLAAAPYGNSSMARQAIINGNFDVWQRGTSFTNPANTAYTADRIRLLYSVSAAPTNVIHSRQALTAGDLPNSFYHYRIAPDGAGTIADGNYYFIQHCIEYGTRFLAGLNKKVTLSFYARSSIANKRMGFEMRQNYGTGGSPTGGEIIKGNTITLTSTWTKYTYTFTTNTLVGKTFGTANDDNLGIHFWMAWGSNMPTTYFTSGTGAETFGGSGTIDIAQVQLCAGDVALPFQPKSYAQELADCRRYCCKAVLNGIAYDANFIALACSFPVEMRVAPTTYTFYVDGDATNTAGSIARLGGADTDVTSLNAISIYKNGIAYINKTGAFTMGGHYRGSVLAQAEL